MKDSKDANSIKNFSETDYFKNILAENNTDAEINQNRVSIPTIQPNIENKVIYES